MAASDRRRISGTAVIAIAIGVAIVISVFRVPLQTFFVFGIALLCPLMMMGMHAGGHAHGQAHGDGHAPGHDERADLRRDRHTGGSGVAR